MKREILDGLQNLNKDIDTFTRMNKKKRFTFNREKRIMRRNIKSLDSCHSIVKEAISDANFEY